ETAQRVVADGLADAPAGADLREVPQALDDPVRDAGRAARHARDARERRFVDGDAEPRGAAADDVLDVRRRIEVELLEQPEASAERRREHALARRRAD